MTEIAAQAAATFTAFEARVDEKLRVDERLRNVEVKQAEMGAIVTQLDKALPAMEQRLIREIQEAKPKNVPSWVMVGVAVAALVISPLLTYAIQR